MGARVDAQFGERIVDVGFHRVGRKVQLGGDVAIRRTLGDEVDDLMLGVGEAVQARFRPRLGDDAALHTEPTQLAAHLARIGERLVAHVGVEGGVELLNRFVSAVGAGE